MTATTIPAVERPYEDIDISSIAFWGQKPEVRDQSFAKLRAKGGVTWHPPVEAQPIPATSAGFWAVTTHAGVVEVSRNPELFSSTQTSPSIYEAGPEILDLMTGFGGMDAPEHTRFRRLVSKAFTPRQLERTDGLIAKRSKLAVDALLETGPCDFVEVFSNYVPAQVITDMVGADDPEVREQLVDAVTKILVFGDPGVRPDGENPIAFFAQTMFELIEASRDVLAERRGNPGEDLVTGLIEAEFEGERLTDDEIVNVLNLLFIAGIDTTRNTLTIALQALTQFPEQRALLMEDLPRRIDDAVVEMVRWASPVSSFVRRATRDTELGGAHIAAGDRVALWYMSANRDETVFDRPWEFDIQRDNSRQIAWGGGGPHYCLGSNLARVETRMALTELLTRIPTIRAVGPEVRASSPMVNSIEHQMCEWDS